MTEFVEQLIQGIIDREKGYVNHPSDRGGPTKYGITEKVARAHGYDDDMKDFPIMFARRIYRQQYYELPGFSRVAAHSQAIAEELTDTGVNMGQNVAATFLQRALNAFNLQGKIYPDLVVDGFIGSQTITALSEYLNYRGKEGEQVMLKALNSLQGARYINIVESRPSQEDFSYGWFNHRIGGLV